MLFVILLAALFTKTGYSVYPESGVIAPVPYKYLHNMIATVWPGIMLITGTVLVLLGLGTNYFSSGKHSFYITAGGIVLAVWSILLCAAFNNTAYFVSNCDIQESLTLYNSSSSLFTLKVMAYVSLIIPAVVAYIAYVWRALTRKKISNEDLNSPDSHKY